MYEKVGSSSAHRYESPQMIGRANVQRSMEARGEYETCYTNEAKERSYDRDLS